MPVYTGDILTPKFKLSYLLLPAGKLNTFLHSRGQSSNQQVHNIPTNPLLSVLSATLCFDCVLSQWNFPAGTSRLDTERLYPGGTDSRPNSQTHKMKI